MAEALRPLAAVTEPLAGGGGGDDRITAARPSVPRDVDIDETLQHDIDLLEARLRDVLARLEPMRADVAFIRANTKALPQPLPPPKPLGPLDFLRIAVSFVSLSFWTLLWSSIPLLWVWIDNAWIDHENIRCRRNMVIVGSRWVVVIVATALAIFRGKARFEDFTAAFKQLWRLLKMAWRLSQVAVDMFPENISVVPLGAILKMGRLVLLLGAASFGWAVVWSFGRLNIYPFLPPWLSSFSLKAALYSYQLLTSLVLQPVSRWVVAVIEHSGPVQFVKAYLTQPLVDAWHLVRDAASLLASVPTLFAWPGAFRMSAETMHRRTRGVIAAVADGLGNMVPVLPTLPPFNPADYYPVNWVPSPVNVTLPAVLGFDWFYRNATTSSSVNGTLPTPSPLWFPGPTLLPSYYTGSSNTTTSTNNTTNSEISTNNNKTNTSLALAPPPAPTPPVAPQPKHEDLHNKAQLEARPPAPSPSPSPSPTTVPVPAVEPTYIQMLRYYRSPIAAAVQPTGEIGAVGAAPADAAPASAPAPVDAAPAPAAEPTLGYVNKRLGLA